MAPRIITARSIGLTFRTNQLARMGRERSVVGHYSGANTIRARHLREGLERVRSFHRHHQSTNRWAGIGYHYLIPDSGEILCCRPVAAKGAQVLRDNGGRTGVNVPGAGADGRRGARHGRSTGSSTARTRRRCRTSTGRRWI